MNDNILDQAEIDALLRMAQTPGRKAGAESPGAGESTPGSEAGPEAGLPPGTGEVPDPDPDADLDADPEALPEGASAVLTREEQDALGEVGNIAMGAAATTLSTLLGKKVSITSPVVAVTSRGELISTFKTPYLVVNIRYTEGLEAGTLLVIRVRDAAVIADLMMGNDGTNPSEELDELGISAASEAMNQMVGTSATSLASLVGRSISISPPTAEVLDEDSAADTIIAGFAGPAVTVSFEMKIGDLVDTEIMQIMNVETARMEAALLWGSLDKAEAEPETAASPAGAPAVPVVEPAAPGAATPPAPGAKQPVRPPESVPEAKVRTPAPVPGTVVDKRKLDLILDIPLKVTVILGRTQRPIQEVLGLAPGAIVELAALADEPVEILVNGVLVAKGEVVVVNENFGVRITSISSPRERMRQLYGGA